MFATFNTVQQGNVGLGMAIALFCSKGWIVSIPLNDCQCYDLVVDAGEGLKKVQVRTTRYKGHRPSKAGDYVVQLQHMHTNRTKNEQRHFDNTTVDLLFVVTEDSRMYLIPAEEIDGKSSLQLGRKCDKYLIGG